MELYFGTRDYFRVELSSNFKVDPNILFYVFDQNVDVPENISVKYIKNEPNPQILTELIVNLKK